MKHATTVAVTGAGGFLGAHICRALCARGYQVIGITRSGSDRVLPPDLDGKIATRDADILNPQSITAAFTGAEVAVHAAALVSLESNTLKKSVDINLNGTQNVIQACIANHASKLIHISSVHAFEPIRGIRLKPDSPVATDSRVPYNQTKAKAQTAVLAAISQNLVGGSVICPSGLIGPFDDRPSTMGSMLLDIVKQKIPMLVNEGFFWTDVRDVATAVTRSVSAEADGNIYFTAGRYATLKHLADLCSDFLGRNVTPPTVPYAAAIAALPIVRAYANLRNLSPLYTRETLNLVRDCPADVDHQAAIEDLDYRPRPLEETVGDALTWFANNGMMP